MDDDTFVTKCKRFLGCNTVEENVEAPYHFKRNFKTYRMRRKTVPINTPPELPPRNERPVCLPEIPPKNENIIKKYVQEAGLSEANVQKSLNIQNTLSLAESSSHHQKEYDLKRESWTQIPLKDPEINLQLPHNDVSVFGKMIVSRFQLEQCISLLTNVKEACEKKISSYNSKNLGMQKMFDNKDVEEKIHFCIKTLSSFDLFFYEDNEIGSQSTSDVSLIVSPKIQAENKKKANMNIKPKPGKKILHSLPSYCDLPSHSFLEMQRDMHHSAEDSVSSHDYESISFPCLGKLNASTSNQKKYRFNHHYEYSDSQNNTDPVENMFSDSVVGETSTQFHNKSDGKEFDCENTARISISDSSCKYFKSKPYIYNQGIFHEETHTKTEYKEIQRRVADWVMSIEISQPNMDQREDETKSQSTIEGAENIYKEDSDTKSNLPDEKTPEL